MYINEFNPKRLFLEEMAAFSMVHVQEWLPLPMGRTRGILQSTALHEGLVVGCGWFNRDGALNILQSAHKKTSGPHEL